MIIHLTDIEAEIFEIYTGHLLNQHALHQVRLSQPLLNTVSHIYEQLLAASHAVPVTQVIAPPLEDKPIDFAGAQARKPVGSVRPVISITKPYRA
jgi:hypothetical protein